MLTFNIKTKPEKYFHQLIEILKVFPPFDNLRKRQREVFAEILLQYYNFRNENEDVSTRLVFDYKTKEEIAIKIGISKGNLYNIYKELRQLKLLTKDGINPKFRFKYLQHDKIHFTFSE
jgi:hypothetical protein